MQNTVFHYRTLRTLIGLAAFAIIILCVILYHVNASSDVETAAYPTSLSLTYHLGARDVFVGILFIVGSFLLAYKGHSSTERKVAFFAAVFAVSVALFPTSMDKLWVVENGFEIDQRVCEAPYSLEELKALAPDAKQKLCNTSLIGSAPTIHMVAAVLLIGSLIYFCRVFYLRAGKKLALAGLSTQDELTLKKRVLIYKACLVAMVISIPLFMGLSYFFPAFDTAVFWIEVVCLSAFGVSWLVAGKQLILKLPNKDDDDEEDRLSEEVDKLSVSPESN
jgi:hypothetical protein